MCNVCGAFHAFSVMECTSSVPCQSCMSFATSCDTESACLMSVVQVPSVVYVKPCLEVFVMCAANRVQYVM